MSASMQPTNGRPCFSECGATSRCTSGSHVQHNYCDSRIFSFTTTDRLLFVVSGQASLSCRATKVRCTRPIPVGSPSLNMRSFVVLFLLLPTVLSSPSPTTEVQDGQTGTLIVVPPQATETGLKRIPGKFHASVERIFLN
jgi:hypothetical protein